MQVFLSLDDKANRELKKLADQLEAVRRAAMVAEAGGGSGKADMQQMTNAMYLKSAELKVNLIRELSAFLNFMFNKSRCFIAIKMGLCYATNLVFGMLGVGTSEHGFIQLSLEWPV